VNRGRPTSFTSEFHEEFQAQTHALLRRRFLWFAGLLTAVATAMLLMSLTAGLAAPKLLPSFAEKLAPCDRAYLAWMVMTAVTCAYRRSSR
jgi:hypothetical protein